MEGINFRGVINVLAGQYLCYLAYKIFTNPADPQDSMLLIRTSCVVFLLAGIALIIFGFRRVILDYKAYKNSPPEDEEEA